VDEVLGLTGVCVYFNSLIKSTFFIKYFITMKERTKIEISMDAFDQSLGGAGTPQEQQIEIAKRLGHTRREKDEMAEENAQAQLEVLKNVKEFLKTKLQQNEQMTLSLEKDVEILKNLLRIEKQINKKDQTRISDLETDLRTMRAKLETGEKENVTKITELEV
jgi:hypothetical protein